jgi:trehalose-6-phosphatase
MHQIGANGIYLVDVKVIKGKGEVEIRVNQVNKGFKNEYN